MSAYAASAEHLHLHWNPAEEFRQFAGWIPGHLYTNLWCDFYRANSGDLHPVATLQEFLHVAASMIV